MIANFDHFQQFDNPHLILCRPGSKATLLDSGEYQIDKAIGQIANPKNFNINYNFNAQWELSFNVSMSLRSKEDGTILIPENYTPELNVFEKIDMFMYIYAEDIGFFKITNVDSAEEGSEIIKSVTAMSCDKELEDFEAPYVTEGTYKLCIIKNAEYNYDDDLSFTSQSSGGETYLSCQVDDPTVITDFDISKTYTFSLYLSTILTEQGKFEDLGDDEYAFEGEHFSVTYCPNDSSSYGYLYINAYSSASSGTYRFVIDSPEFFDYIMGDANNDGVISDADATITLQIAAGIVEPNAYQEVVCDMDGDGTISSTDARNISTIAKNGSTTLSIPLLNLFRVVCPNWTIGYVDEDLDGVYRYFEDTSDISMYEFLWDRIETAFECVIEPDYILRELNFYTKAHWANEHKTKIHIAKNNLIDKLSVSSDIQDIFTCVDAYGDSDDLDIRPINPTGENTIYNFSGYMSSMSEHLQAVVEDWQDIIDTNVGTESSPGAYYTASLSYYQKLEATNIAEQALYVAQENLRLATADYNNTKNNTSDASIIAMALANKNTATADVATNQSAYNSAKALSDAQAAVVDGIIANCKFSKVLHDYCVDEGLSADVEEELRQELNFYIREAEYRNEYLTVTDSMSYLDKFAAAKTLYFNAKSYLAEVSTSTRKFTIDTKSFLFNKDFRMFSEELVPGCIIHCETSNDFIEELQCTDISVNYSDRNTSLTFSNKSNKYDITSLYKDLFGSISSSKASVVRNSSAIRAISATLDDTVTTSNKSVKVKLSGDSLKMTKDAWAHDSLVLGELKGSGISGTEYGLGTAPKFQKTLVIPVDANGDWENTYYRKTGDDLYTATTQASYEISGNSEIYYLSDTNVFTPVFNWDVAKYYYNSSATQTPAYVKINKSTYEASLAVGATPIQVYCDTVVDYYVKVLTSGLEAKSGHIGGIEISPTVGICVDDKEGSGGFLRIGTQNNLISGSNIPYAITLSNRNPSDPTDRMSYFHLRYDGYTYIRNLHQPNDSSDRDIKSDIGGFDDRYDKFYDSLSPQRYKYIGRENEGYHTGFIANDVDSALEDSGLDITDFAALHRCDEVNEDGSKYELRKDEIVALNMWQIQKLKEEVKTLTSEIAKLKSELSQTDSN